MVSKSSVLLSLVPWPSLSGRQTPTAGTNSFGYGGDCIVELVAGLDIAVGTPHYIFICICKSVRF